MTQDEKIELVNYLIFLRGKLQSLAIKLLLMGEDPEEVDKAEEDLAKKINLLRVNLMQQWQGDAKQLLAELKQSNEKAQRHLRELKDSQDRAGKLANILDLIDRGLGAVAALVI
jgi:hypothetical protein